LSVNLSNLSDDALVSQLEAIRGEGQRLLARLLVHLIEVEERSLHLRVACSSLFDFCRRRLGMSEGAAFRRIIAARLVRRFPRLLGHIERGDIHLSALVSLRKHLTEANIDEVVASVVGKSKREVEELVARREPRPDVPATIRKLPTPRASVAMSAVAASSAGGAANAGSAASAASAGGGANPTPTGVAVATSRPQVLIEPLSEARYRLQLTASAELRAKLERARDLMGHRNPGGDLAVVVERALDALLEKLERERLGKTRRPPAPSPNGKREVSPRKSGRITSAARRAVFERDGEQCSFLDPEGRRCPARTLLELDHVESKALGGSHAPANLRVFCRPHNLLHAEVVFGREYIARRIRVRQRKSQRSDAQTMPMHDTAEPP
jgi:5-methylcytosine-specific restriction endonuclease McrA